MDCKATDAMVPLPHTKHSTAARSFVIQKNCTVSQDAVLARMDICQHGAHTSHRLTGVPHNPFIIIIIMALPGTDYPRGACLRRPD
eukprot:3934792-Rhodomonas_salina.1